MCSRSLSAMRWVSLALALLTIVPRGGARAWGDDVPRYKLKVGQELTYRTADDPNAKVDDGQSRARFEWIFTPIVQNADGGWRVVYRGKTSHGGSRVRNSTGYFDLRPDGQIAVNPTVTLNANPTSVFPAMPADAAAIQSGWSSTLALDETRRDYKAPQGPPAADAATWSFEEDTQTVFSPIYQLVWHHQNEFDVQQGLMRKITSTYTQGWPKRDKANGYSTTLELVDKRQIDSPELTALAAEMLKYFEVCAAYDELMGSQDFANMKPTLEKAETVLKNAEGEFKLPLVQEMLKEKIKEHTQSANYQLQNAEKFGKLIGQPSEAWQTTDLDDHPRSLADYQGKVVLLDFWYRGCGWCIRAMPQLKQVSDDFPRDKVAVLGINNDQNIDDARFVIEKMGLTYETLKNGDRENIKDAIHNKYGVQGWPTLVILDGKGVVRDVHVGYSPNLRKELGDKIRELLAEAGSAAK